MQPECYLCIKVYRQGMQALVCPWSPTTILELCLKTLPYWARMLTWKIIHCAHALWIVDYWCAGSTNGELHVIHRCSGHAFAACCLVKEACKWLFRTSVLLWGGEELCILTEIHSNNSSMTTWQNTYRHSGWCLQSRFACRRMFSCKLHDTDCIYGTLWGRSECGCGNVVEHS